MEDDLSRGKPIYKDLLKASNSALFAGIEIHNKPLVEFRYQSVVILIIIAWEHLLKAYVYKFMDKKLLYENKTNKENKKITRSFKNILDIVKYNVNEKYNNNKFDVIYENIKALYSYRNEYVHYFTNEMEPIIFMLIYKSVLLYNDFIKKHFDIDITLKDSLFIMPIGFKLPLNPIDYLKQDYNKRSNKFVNQIIQSIRNLNKNGIQESILISFSLSINKGNKNADLIAKIDKYNEKAITLRQSVRITDNPNAPEFRFNSDLPPLGYYELRDKIKFKYPNVRCGKLYNKIMQEKIKTNDNLCRINYLDPNNKLSSKKYFYFEEAVDVFIEEYKRQERYL
ncbi:MAG: DUF3644 domain-containing protein [Abditibacteriota bacterium]|nr:DUF3644 domain-containing protein [Abditibacteriota bacterium]